MKKLVTLILIKMLFYSSLTTADDKDQVICQFAGQTWMPNNYTLSAKDIPERCDIIAYGTFIADYEHTDPRIKPEDKDAIKSLASIKKEIYICLSYEGDNTWAVVNLDDDQKKAVIDPFIDLLNELKISGVLLNIKSIYTGKSGFDGQISVFANDIKKKVPKLKVGLIIDGKTNDYFSKPDEFNFETTNKDIDLYIIDFTPENECTKDIREAGLVPIKSDDEDVVSMEKINNGVFQSTMDKAKIYAKLKTGIIIPVNLLAPPVIGSYSDYCINVADPNNMKTLKKWCTDNSQTLFDKGKFVIDTKYHGLMITYLETDDYKNSCECGMFPGTNLIIDGFENKPYKKCVKLEMP